VRPLALAIASLLVVGGVAAAARSGENRPPDTVAAAWSPPQPTGRLGRAPEDELPLSDPQPLDLLAVGYELPPGSSVYAARVVTGDGRPRYVDYVAGGGALAGDFWPASSIKVLAALGALDFAASLGFTGAATVTFDTGYVATIREIYESAVLGSDNLDYDVLIRIAGFDRLNTDFLSPANGFPATVIQRSYAGIDVRWSPEMTLDEDGRTIVVPAREGAGEYGCADDGNCSNLFEMTEAVRRLVLDGSVPDDERFAISPADVQALTDALAGTGLACVDTAVVTGAAGDRYLLSATIPDDDFDEECGGLSELAAAVLPLIAGP